MSTVTLDGETADKIAIDSMKFHYDIIIEGLQGDDHSICNEEIAQAFRDVLSFYGESIPVPPKPRECWAVMYDDGDTLYFDTKEDAVRYNDMHSVGPVCLFKLTETEV